MSEPQEDQQAAVVAGRQAKPGRRGRKRSRRYHVARVLLLLAAAPMFFAMMATALVIDRDITAPSWIAARVSARAAEVLGGGTLHFGTVSLTLGRDLHPRVRVGDAVLRDATGAPLAEVSEITGVLSPRGLLFEQAALFQEVTLRGTDIVLRRNADGTVAFAFDFAAADLGVAPSLAALLAQVEQVRERPALAALRQIRLDGLGIIYADARAGRRWIVDDGEILLDLRDRQTVLTAAAFVLSGDSVTELALRYASPHGQANASIRVDIADARTADIATQSPALAWLAALDAPLSAQLETSLDDMGQLGPLQASLALGAGALRPGGTADTLLFDAISTRLTYVPEQDSVGFDSLEINSDWGRIAGRGQALLGAFANGSPGDLLGQFTLHDIAINPMGLYPGVMPVTDADIDFRLRLNPLSIDIGQAVLSGDDFAVAARGHLAAGPAGWNVALDAHLDRISYADVRAIWPESLKPGSREWFATHVHDGELRDFNAGFRNAPDLPARLSMGFDFAQTTLTYLKTLPQMTQAHGSASLIDNRLMVALTGGQVLAPTGGAVDLTGTVLTVADTRVKPGALALDLRLGGTITAILSLLDQPPFLFLTKANRAVTLADGLASLSGQIMWLAKPKQNPGDVRFDVTADLRRVRSNDIVPGRALTAAQVVMHVTNAGMTFDGQIMLDGVAADATWTRPFGGAVASSRLTASVVLSPAFLDAFNIALPQGSLRGQGRGDLVMDLRDGAPPGFTLSSDLRGIALSLPPIGWSKPAGATGHLAISGTLGTPPRFDRLEISAGGLAAVGGIDLTAAGALETARFSRVQIGNWLDAPVTLRGRGRGRPVGVTISGGSVDLRNAPFDRQGGDGSPAEIALDRLQISDGIALSQFRGSFTGAGGFSGQFRGRVNGGPQVQGSVVPQNGRSAIRLTSADAGGVASAAGLIKTAVGGTLDVTLRPTAAEGTFDGVLAVRGLRLRDAPTMAALLDAISVVGLLQQLDGQGLSFDAVDAQFQLTPRRLIVTQASAVGPGLGISLDGIYTLASRQLDFQGVISPFYILNGIGAVLTRRGEGLIGFTYGVAGTAAAPQVSVNPLSAFTPGMFRDIFRRPPPQAGR